MATDDCTFFSPGMLPTVPQADQMFSQMWHQLLCSTTAPSPTTTSSSRSYSPTRMSWRMPSTMLSSMFSSMLQSTTTTSPSASVLPHATSSTLPSPNLSRIVSKYMCTDVFSKMLYRPKCWAERHEAPVLLGASCGTSRLQWIPKLLPSCPLQ